MSANGRPIPDLLVTPGRPDEWWGETSVRIPKALLVDGTKGAANRPPLLGADGDVLQIRLGAAEPPGGRHILPVRRMDAAGGGVDQLGQRVDVGAR